jgi:hypothetical protein
MALYGMAFRSAFGLTGLSSIVHLGDFLSFGNESGVLARRDVLE